MKLIKCIALLSFTQFVPGFGQIHGDPDSSEKKAKFPEIPEDYVETMVDAGKVEIHPDNISDEPSVADGNSGKKRGKKSNSVPPADTDAGAVDESGAPVEGDGAEGGAPVEGEADESGAPVA